MLAYNFIDGYNGGVGEVSDAVEHSGHIIEKLHGLKERPVLREGSKGRNNLTDVGVSLL